MDVSDKNWAITGAIIIGSISALVFSPWALTGWAPIPFYILVLLWIFPFLSFSFLPFLYLVGFSILYKNKYFGWFVFFLCSVFLFLSLFYFFVEYDAGIRYHGISHTKTVILQNLISFAFIFPLSLFGALKNLRNFQYGAYLSLFVFLAWCAFPALGELP